MKIYSVFFTNADGERVGDKVSITSQTEEDAAAKFAKHNFSKEPYIRVQTFLGWKELDNPRSATRETQRRAEEAQKQAEEAQKQAEEAQRQADIASLGDLIGTLKTDSSEGLKYSHLETLIENHLLFPQLNENEDSEIYRLREELYMLSVRHLNLQTIIQTRILSDKLDELQKAITGSAGAPQTTSGQPKWAPLATSVALSKLSNIEKDVDDVADGFFGGD